MKRLILACLLFGSTNLLASCKECYEMEKFLKEEFFECIQRAEWTDSTDELLFYQGQRDILQKCLEMYGYKIERY